MRFINQRWGLMETTLAETTLADLRALAARVRWRKCTSCTTKSIQKLHAKQIPSRYTLWTDSYLACGQDGDKGIGGTALPAWENRVGTKGGFSKGGVTDKPSKCRPPFNNPPFSSLRENLHPALLSTALGPWRSPQEWAFPRHLGGTTWLTLLV